jgi:hypothetical protein
MGYLYTVFPSGTTEEYCPKTMTKFLTLITLLLFVCTSNAQNADSLIFTQDPYSKSEEAIFENKLVLKTKGGNRTIYQNRSATIVKDTSFSFKDEKLHFETFVLYDEPTGLSKDLIYDWNEALLYESDWYDDDATGDAIQPNSINFQTLKVDVVDGAPKKYYSISIHRFRQPQLMK